MARADSSKVSRCWCRAIRRSEVIDFNGKGVVGTMGGNSASRHGGGRGVRTSLFKRVTSPPDEYVDSRNILVWHIYCAKIMS